MTSRAARRPRQTHTDSSRISPSRLPSRQTAELVEVYHHTCGASDSYIDIPVRLSSYGWRPRRAIPKYWYEAAGATRSGVSSHRMKGLVSLASLLLLPGVLLAARPQD